MIGKTADVTVVQRTLSDTLYEQGKPQKVTAERQSCIKTYVWKVDWKGKMCWENAHKQLGELVKASRATMHRCVQEMAASVAFLPSSHPWTRESNRSVLPGLKRKRVWSLLGGPKVSYFCLMTSFLESLISFSTRTLHWLTVPKLLVIGFVRRKMRNTKPNNTDELKATTWASITLQQCHRLIAAMLCYTDAVNLPLSTAGIVCWTLTFPHYNLFFNWSHLIF